MSLSRKNTSVIASIKTYPNPNRTLLPHVIGDGSERVFFEAEAGLVSSLYPLDQSISEHLTYPVTATQYRSRSLVQTKRLDDIPEVKGSHYLKIDVEGAELDVVQNAVEVLSNALIVDLEINLLPNQVGGCMYFELGQFMHEHGFLVHQFNPLRTLNFHPWVQPKGISQDHSADLVFVRDFRKADDLSPEELVIVAVILQDIYRSNDFTSYFLQCHDKATGGDLFHVHSKFDWM